MVTPQNADLPERSAEQREDDRIRDLVRELNKAHQRVDELLVEKYTVKEILKLSGDHYIAQEILEIRGTPEGFSIIIA